MQMEENSPMLEHLQIAEAIYPLLKFTNNEYIDAFSIQQSDGEDAEGL
jgi:hypothetical protein